MYENNTGANSTGKRKPHSTNSNTPERILRKKKASTSSFTLLCNAMLNHNFYLFYKNLGSLVARTTGENYHHIQQYYKDSSKKRRSTTSWHSYQRRLLLITSHALTILIIVQFLLAGRNLSMEAVHSDLGNETFNNSSDDFGARIKNIEMHDTFMVIVEDTVESITERMEGLLEDVEDSLRIDIREVVDDAIPVTTQEELEKCMTKSDLKQNMDTILQQLRDSAHDELLSFISFIIGENADTLEQKIILDLEEQKQIELQHKRQQLSLWRDEEEDEESFYGINNIAAFLSDFEDEALERLDEMMEQSVSKDINDKLTSLAPSVTKTVMNEWFQQMEKPVRLEHDNEDRDLVVVDISTHE